MANKYGLPTMGDSRTIDEYKDFGDWGQNRGKRTLDALANLLGIFGNVSNQAKKEKEQSAYKKALLSQIQEQNLLPAVVPDKIDTSGMEIPYNEKHVFKNDVIQRDSINLPKGIKTVQRELPTIPSKKFPGELASPEGSISTTEQDAMYAPYKEMGIEELLNSMAQRTTLEPKRPLNKTMGSGDTPMDKAKEIRAYMETLDYYDSTPEEQKAVREAYKNVMRQAGAFQSGTAPTPGSYFKK